MTDTGENQASVPLKKSILLVDANVRTREARAANMRKLGATVDAASNAAMAVRHFGAGSYRLVLIDLGKNHEGAERLAREIRLKNPLQSVAFMVEGPTLISKTLGPLRPAPIVQQEQPAEQASSADSEFGRAVKEAEVLQANNKAAAE